MVSHDSALSIEPSGRFPLEMPHPEIYGQQGWCPRARLLVHLEIGEYSTIGEEAIIYNLTRIRIGSRATISQRAHICGGTHDHTRPEFPLIKTPISIGDDVWVAADAFIGPGVNVGDGAVVGARAVVTADVSPWIVVAGNPATMIKTRSLIPEITE